ncbi:MAG TPA: hypothetical protein PK779_10570, partial [Niabella sp.]|nr:hypothetical protein [Niabella sp.]
TEAAITKVKNQILMVTEAQHNALISECKQWYDVLVSYRTRINNLKNELYLFAPGKTEDNVLRDIEHFHNQFHIQLINVHDLKHQIKHHITEADRHPNFGHRIPHHFVKEKFDNLLLDLDKLEDDFHSFVNS